MKNKGFTLIELLAVIVILAVIALIAVPIILNVIDTSKKGSVESSMLGYVDALEKQVMMAKVDTSGLQIPAGTYTVTDLTNLKVNVKGDKPDSTSVFIINSKGQVVEAWATFYDGEYKVYYNGKHAVADKENYKDSNGENHNEIAPAPTTPLTPDPEPEGPTKVDAQTGDTHKGIVYLNPTDITATCTAFNSTIGDGTSGCMRWYIFDDSGDNYKMILDHNTENNVYWNSSGNNVAYASSGAYTSIQGLITSKHWDSSLAPTLITTSEINSITGKTGFNASSASSWYYLDSLNQTRTALTQGSSNYAWLYDYTDDCTPFGCNTAKPSIRGQAYWTQDIVGTNGYYIWVITRNGALNRSEPLGYQDTGVWSIEEDEGDSFMDVFSHIGVRPVITVPKTAFN